MTYQKEYQNNDRTILKEGRTMRNHDTRIIMRKLTGSDYSEKLLPLQYGIAHSAFGRFVVALTPQGVFEVGFIDDRLDEYRAMLEEARKSRWIIRDDIMAAQCFNIFLGNVPKDQIEIYVSGTPFEIEVWSALLDIPFGETITYDELARRIGRPESVRAVTAAVARNHIAYIIPCHRVVCGENLPGTYRWGTKRKSDILAWERKCVRDYSFRTASPVPAIINDFSFDPLFAHTVLQEA